jgi:hypothetical protein
MLCLPTFASEPCLHFEPEVVELVGTMKSRVFPGPPNFQSVKVGDAPEKYWVLHLAKPICVAPIQADSNKVNEPESGVLLLQLNQPDYKGSKHLLGKRVKVKGRLIHAITGHHHTKVMLEVLSIEPAT